MGRVMPIECEHGVTVDWGDFGPCQDCSQHERGKCPNLVQCEKCEAARPIVIDREVADDLVARITAALDGTAPGLLAEVAELLRR